MGKPDTRSCFEGVKDDSQRQFTDNTENKSSVR